MLANAKSQAEEIMQQQDSEAQDLEAEASADDEEAEEQ